LGIAAPRDFDRVSNNGLDMPTSGAIGFGLYSQIAKSPTPGLIMT
jgi:hypothetical protein